mmetsp:Transcript_5643/g.20219  ORF Transcript_5643/g.20219 Transcript_5643/m.20219 type:complete len:212 (+) Transcript_5643:1113-1748(+)
MGTHSRSEPGDSGTASPTTATSSPPAISPITSPLMDARTRWLSVTSSFTRSHAMPPSWLTECTVGTAAVAGCTFLLPLTSATMSHASTAAPKRTSAHVSPALFFSSPSTSIASRGFSSPITAAALSGRAWMGCAGRPVAGVTTLTPAAAATAALTAARAAGPSPSRPAPPSAPPTLPPLGPPAWILVTMSSPSKALEGSKSPSGSPNASRS